MKKFLIAFYLFSFIFIIGSLNVSANISTGHDEITKVYFNGDGKLLIDYTTEEINDCVKKIKRKGFGWKSVYFNYKRKIQYDGEIIFSKVNRSDGIIKFTYDMQNETVNTVSTSKSGSINAKIGFDLSKIFGSITGGGSAGIDKKNVKESTIFKETKIDINIMPGTKLTLMTKGDAYITSGYSKYYFFWITVKKGSWETIEIDTVYYELIEEKL